MADIQSPGTAVQSAVTADGQTWEYDNKGGSWVNLNTGQSLKPGEFAAFAGRSSNAAANTAQLADEMRREEAALTRQVLPPRGPTPVPTSVGAQGLSVPASAPVVSPETLARVAVQRPTPTVYRPPSDQDWMKAYTRNGQVYWDELNRAKQFAAQSEYRRRVNAGEDPNKVMEALRWDLIPPGKGSSVVPKPISMQFHQGGTFNPQTGQWTPIKGIPEKQPGKVEEVTHEGKKYVRVTQPSGIVVEKPIPEDPDLKSLRSTEQRLMIEAEKATDPHIEVNLTKALLAVRQQIADKTKTPPAAAMVAPTPAAVVAPPIKTSDNVPEFDSEQKALASGVKGIVKINGRKARID